MAFASTLSNNLIPGGDILNRKIDFQRDIFLKGISNTKHGKKEDPTYIYFKFIFDFGDNYFLDPETFLAPSPLFRSYNTDYNNLTSNRNTYENAAGLTGDTKSKFESAMNNIDAQTQSGFLSDMDFFYGSKGKISGMEGNGFYNINGGGLGYMGAQQFLSQRSDKRQQMLQAFKNGINFINKECPYYFQSLGGLDALLKTDIKNYHKAGGAPKRAGTLTIDCLESIDMRMFSLAELYRKAVYDYTYHRSMLPENLRKFRMWLVVTELRNIQLTHNINDVLNPFSIPSVAAGANFLESFNSQTGLLDQASGLMQKSTNTENPGKDKFGSYSMGPYAFIYQFDQCEFDFDATYPSYGSIDNKGGAAVTSQFKIHVGRVKDYKIQFNQLSDVIKKNDNIQQMVLSDVWGSVNSGYTNYDYFETAGIENATFSEKADPGAYFAGLASNFVMNTVADLKNQGVSMLENKLLGNIYGFGGVNIGAAASSVQSIMNTLDAGIPNPLAKNDPQSRGYGGPSERQYPSANSDFPVYGKRDSVNGQALGNVLGGSSNPTGSISGDAYPNNPGSDLGLPDRTYPVNTTDEYANVPGSDLGVPSRIYPTVALDQYTNTPGPDLGLPDRTYPVNNSDEYTDVPGADLGVPNRVYPTVSLDVYTNTPGSDLGVPNRVYPTNNIDEYASVPGADLGVPNRVYPNTSLDVYPDTPGADLGVPNRVYPQNNIDEYTDVPGADLGVPNRVYPVPQGDQYANTPGSDLGLPDRQYPSVNFDEYKNVPGPDLGVAGRTYTSVNDKTYTPQKINYPGVNDDEYESLPEVNTKNIGRIYTKS